jgi:two-component system response regulator AtoC
MRKELGKRRKRLSEELKAALLSYNWPGNVRELRNVIERAVVLSSAPVLALSDVPPEIRSSARATAVREENKLERAEKALLLKALQRSNGNISAAARELGVSRDTLRYRMGKFGLRAKSPSAWVISPEN